MGTSYTAVTPEGKQAVTQMMRHGCKGVLALWTRNIAGVVLLVKLVLELTNTRTIDIYPHIPLIAITVSAGVIYAYYSNILKKMKPEWERLIANGDFKLKE